MVMSKNEFNLWQSSDLIEFIEQQRVFEDPLNRLYKQGSQVKNDSLLSHLLQHPIYILHYRLILLVLKWKQFSEIQFKQTLYINILDLTVINFRCLKFYVYNNKH